MLAFHMEIFLAPVEVSLERKIANKMEGGNFLKSPPGPCSSKVAPTSPGLLSMPQKPGWLISYFKELKEGGWYPIRTNDSPVFRSEAEESLGDGNWRFGVQIVRHP